MIIVPFFTHVFCFQSLGEDPPGTACGPTDNPGACELGCPCNDTPLQCPNFDDQCTVLEDPDACCCYDAEDTVPDVCAGPPPF